MNDVECPYCKSSQEICHDDGYGYEEDEIHDQECSNCGKTFGFTTYISYDYEVKELPCKNGEEHDLQDVKCIPKEFGVGRKRCSCCDEVIIVDKEANKKAVESYYEKMKEKS